MRYITLLEGTLYIFAMDSVTRSVLVKQFGGYEGISVSNLFLNTIYYRIKYRQNKYIHILFILHGRNFI